MNFQYLLKLFKTIESKEIQLVVIEEVNYLHHQGLNYISDNSQIFELLKNKIDMNKPIFIGQTMLDLSEILKRKFCYGYLIPK